MQAITARMSTKYQVVIPKPVREALGLQPQARLLFLMEGDTVILRPQPTNFAETLRGMHRELWPDPDEWLESERASWEAP
ncbi:MAG TPA: AbrB/MazE/SpoVT family DNA-binding domain-containing protein [Anaerolineae bacterium]|nr:AbrB/MazE/SpoVT family DNA-binding domain-containing protein [Anaerolineae bacterium]